MILNPRIKYGDKEKIRNSDMINENTMYKNVWDATKAEFRRERHL